MPNQYQLRLNDDRVIHLEQLFQYRTYAGLKVAVPTHEANQKRIQLAVRYARQQLWGGGSPYLIEPTERDSPVPEGWMSDLQPVEIPGVACLAVFESEEERPTSLKVVWFQDGFALPVDVEIEERLRGVDWERLAADAT